MTRALIFFIFAGLATLAGSIATAWADGGPVPEPAPVEEPKPAPTPKPHPEWPPAKSEMDIPEPETATDPGKGRFYGGAYVKATGFAVFSKKFTDARAGTFKEGDFTSVWAFDADDLSPGFAGEAGYNYGGFTTGLEYLSYQQDYRLDGLKRFGEGDAFDLLPEGRAASLRVQTAMANFGYNPGIKPLSPYVFGGVGVGFIDDEISFNEGDRAWRRPDLEGTGLAWQAGGGVEVPLGPQLSAFAEARWHSVRAGDDDISSLLAGGGLKARF